MKALAERDRLRSLIDMLVESLDARAAGDELAARVFLSRYHFGRLTTAALGESPGAFRRRLLLERAAYELSNGASVMETALGAGYASAEAFARAFRRAYASPPSTYRGEFKLVAPNGVHFHPPGGLLVPGDDSGRHPMDLTERMIEHDNWLTHRLIESAAGIAEEELDTPVELEPETPAFAESAPSIRAMLDRLVFTKEMWSAAIAGREFHRNRDTTLAGLKQRLDAARRGIRRTRPRHSRSERMGQRVRRRDV